jgi:PIN domain nuclease of toxin-antitoxin system
MNSVVLDASAILAVARNEPDADVVNAHRANAIVSAVNHMEVVPKLLRFDIPMNEIEIFLSEAFPSVTAFDRQQANLAAQLHAENRNHRLSYADVACLARAMTRNILVLTGDRKWATVPLNVEVRLFR